MVWPSFVLCLSLIGVALLAGCEGTEKAVSNISDGKSLLTAYVSVYTTVFVLLLLFGSGTLLQNLLDTLRFIGIAQLVVCPLIYGATGRKDLAIAMAISGSLGAIGVTVAFWKDLYPQRIKKDGGTPKKEA